MSIRQRTSFVRRAERCVSQCDVDMLFALDVRCFELIKVQNEAIRLPALHPIGVVIGSSLPFF